MRRARPKDATPQTLRMLKETSKACTTCTARKIRGTRFRVTMPTEIRAFNQDLPMDIMYLGDAALLHIVEIATGFGNVAILPWATFENLCYTFGAIWATVYPGHPNKLRIDS